MKNKTLMMAASAVMVAGMAGVQSGRAAVALVDFETTPALSQGPSIYVAVPAQQTITAEPATFTGGVVLGDATFFPAISFATAPNVYGTADFGNGLATSLGIAIDPTFTTTEVSFALFNGETFNQSYVVNAFNGSTLVASQTLSNMAPNFNSGYGLVDVTAAGGITNVTVAPVGDPGVWDFLIDTVAFNESISTIVPPTPPTVIPPAPPVQGHQHGHGKGETELVEVDFGDDVNDIRGSVQLVQAPAPEPASLGIFAVGAVGLFTRRRRM